MMARTIKHRKSVKVCPLSSQQFQCSCLVISSYLKSQLSPINIETDTESDTSVSIKLLTENQDFVFGDYLISYYAETSSVEVLLRMGDNEVSGLVNAIADRIRICCTSLYTLEMDCSEYGIMLPEDNVDAFAEKPEHNPEPSTNKAKTKTTRSRAVSKTTKPKSAKSKNSAKTSSSTRAHQSAITENTENKQLMKIILPGIATGLTAAIVVAAKGVNIGIVIVVFCFSSIVGGWLGHNYE